MGRYGKRNRKLSILLTFVLLVVTAISIGFASFSNTLTISSSVMVIPDQDSFKIEFSSSETEVLTTSITPNVISSLAEYTTTPKTAIIENGSTPTISNLGATFSDTGATTQLLYQPFVHNTGKYDAYLTDIIFNNVSGTNSSIKCTAIEGTSQSKVDEICGTIVLKVIVTGVDTSENNKMEDTTETIAVTNHILKKGEVEDLRIVISYSSTAGNIADGDFTVEFGDISLVYSTTDVYNTGS